LVVRPGFGMTPGLGFALLAGCFHGCYLVTTRWLAGAYRPRFLLLSQLVIGAFVLAPTAIGPMPEITLPLAGFIVIKASVIAPFIYSQIIIATVYGFAFFGEWPDPAALLGLGSWPPGARNASVVNVTPMFWWLARHPAMTRP